MFSNTQCMSDGYGLSVCACVSAYGCEDVWVCTCLCVCADVTECLKEYHEPEPGIKWDLATIW